MDPLIGRLLAGSPELRDDWDREVAKEARRGKAGDMTEAAALAWATLTALQAGRDCQKLFVDLDEILRESPGAGTTRSASRSDPGRMSRRAAWIGRPARRSNRRSIRARAG